MEPVIASRSTGVKLEQITWDMKTLYPTLLILKGYQQFLLLMQGVYIIPQR